MIMENDAGFSGRKSRLLESCPHRFYGSINGGWRDGQEHLVDTFKNKEGVMR